MAKKSILFIIVLSLLLPSLVNAVFFQYNYTGTSRIDDACILANINSTNFGGNTICDLSEPDTSNRHIVMMLHNDSSLSRPDGARIIVHNLTGWVNNDAGQLGGFAEVRVTVPFNETGVTYNSTWFNNSFSDEILYKNFTLQTSGSIRNNTMNFTNYTQRMFDNLTFKTPFLIKALSGSSAIFTVENSADKPQFVMWYTYASLISSVTLNESNASLVAGMNSINASATLGVESGDKINWTFNLYVDRVFNSTCSNTNSTTVNQTISCEFKNKNFEDNDVIHVQVNGSNGYGEFDFNALIPKGSTTFQNSTAITVPSSNTAPVLSSPTINYTNATLTMTSENINASISAEDSNSGDKLNYTIRMFVNSIANISFAGIVNNQRIDNLSGVLTNSNITKGQVLIFQFNATDGIASSNFINSSALIVNDTTPVLSAGTVNYTNSSLKASGENINATITSTDLDVNDKANITFTFFVNRVANLTAQLKDYASTSNTLSFVFTNTNITAGQVITIQVNATSTGNAVDGTYVNITPALTVGNSSIVFDEIPSLNVTNSTLKRNGFINTSLKFTDIDNDRASITMCAFRNRTIKQDTCTTLDLQQTGSNVSFAFNGSYSKNDLVEIQFNDSSVYQNSTGITVGDSAGIINSMTANVTNSTLFANANVNISVDISDPDSQSTNITICYYVNNVIASSRCSTITNAVPQSNASIVISGSWNGSQQIIFQANGTSSTGELTSYQNLTTLLVATADANPSGQGGGGVTTRTFTPITPDEEEDLKKQLEQEEVKATLKDKFIDTFKKPYVYIPLIALAVITISYGIAMAFRKPKFPNTKPKKDFLDNL